MIWTLYIFWQLNRIKNLLEVEGSKEYKIKKSDNKKILNEKNAHAKDHTIPQFISVSFEGWKKSDNKRTIYDFFP